MKKVYTAMLADLLHSGHINILSESAKLGDVTVGLLTDKAGGELDDVPFLPYESRKAVLESVQFVKDVVPQETASYKSNLLRIRPDFVVRGDDWVQGPQRKFREEVVELLKEWGGQLIEIPYSREINESSVKSKLDDLGISTGQRLGRFRRLVESKPLVKVLEVHNALSGLIAENSSAIIADGRKASFDAMWSSSLTDSTAKGKPDIEAVDTTARLTTINEIFEVTTKPMIYDGDTGGIIEHFEFTVRSLERTGVGAVVIEDKTGLKKNSLFGNEVAQTQESIEKFCAKIKAGKKAQVTRDFMLFARVESLILDSGMDDAIKRARAYVDAGADGVMIHSRKKDPAEIKEFMHLFRSKDSNSPVIVVPTSFNQITVDEFITMGVNVVIYANHMLRAAYPGMLKVAESILQHGRSLEAEGDCMPVKEILDLIPGTR